MSNRRFNVFENRLAVLALFTGAALLIFSAGTNRIFLSDDYCTILNVSKGHILLPSFFRPGGDLTLRWNFLLFGDDPFYYYVTNIMLHVLNSFLLYLFCMQWFRNNDGRVIFSVLAAIMFLTYPSHSEAILWTIGRGVLLAVTFSLTAMISFHGKMATPWKYLAVCVSYFFAMACYESVLLLPFVLFVAGGNEPRRRLTTWGIVLTATLMVHLMLRYYFTGGLWEGYNGIIFSKDLLQYADSFLKIVLRLFIPPFNHPLLFSIAGVAAVALVIYVLHRNRKIIEQDLIFVKTFTLAIAGLLCSILVATSFGVSTRTSEGDRLLYFPSIFYCLMISLLIVKLVGERKKMIAVALAILIFQLAFLLNNQQHWISASRHAEKIIATVSNEKSRPLYIINMPSDYKGAFVFRNCFKQALVHFGIDSNDVTVVNVVRSENLDRSDTLITPVLQGQNVFIWPETLIEGRNNRVVTINGDTINARGLIYYWNRRELVKLK